MLACRHGATSAHREIATNEHGGVSDTEDIEQAFVREMRRRWRLVRGAVRRSVGYATDAFGLAGPTTPRTLENTAVSTANERIDGLAEPYDDRRQAVLIDRFANDFDEWVREGVLEPTAFSSVREGQHWMAEFTDDAVRRGWSDGGERLQQAGAGGVQITDDALGNLGVPKQHLRRLYDRAYEDLENITDAAGQVMREELTQGFAAGENPRQIATRLTKRIQSLERTRAETLARTHVIDAYNTAALDRYESYGVGTVSHGSWMATGDTRTCPICSALDGQEYRISEFRTDTFEFQPGDDDPTHLAGSYPIRPPAHPRCRCVIVPNI